jgi:polysaccharide pyruvyl transferase WcaK-like protein
MGFGNLGDAATQDAVIANIKKRMPNADIVGFSLVPQDTIQRHGIPCHPIRWTNEPGETVGDREAGPVRPTSRVKSVLRTIPLMYPLAKSISNLLREAKFWLRSYRILRTLDLMIISGGGQLDDLWHGHPYTVFKFCVLSRLARTKLYLLNVGVGPLKYRSSKFFTRWAVRCANYRSVRDLDSQERLRNIGARVKTLVFPDLVYALEVPARVNKVPRFSAKPVVGVNPMGFCDPRLWPRKENYVYQEYLEKITRFSLWLLDHGYALRVFTTDIGVDRLAIEDLKGRLSSKLSPEALAEIFTTPTETVPGVLKEMAGFDVVVTSKFHGIIFSQLLNKPVISLSYHRKMDFAMQAVGQSHLCANIEHFQHDWLIQALSLVVQDGATIESQSSAAVRTNAAALSQQLDGLFPPRKSGATMDSRSLSMQRAEKSLRA